MLDSAQPRFDLSVPESLILDTDNPKPKDVIALNELFQTDVKNRPDLGPLPVVTGWNEITPVKAIELLRRNLPGANRKLDPQTVNYYALQMVHGLWKETGQPILVDSNGRLVDGQHRLYAMITTGSTIRTYVVTEIDSIPNLFAYIDNCRSRSAATALQTAGLNGTSAVIVKIMKLAEEVRLGVFDSSGIAKLPRLTPVENIELAANYPNVQMAARAAVTDWESVDSFLGGRRKDVVGYLGMRIIDLHGAEVADDFFDLIMDPADLPAGHPVAELHKVIEKDNKKEKPLLKREHQLAALTLAFNAWIKNETLEKRWMQGAHEDMPRLVEPQSEEEPA
jgi:hypothetical protein